jgi:hypothetical protein
MSRQYNYELTAYPVIYGGSYWGNGIRNEPNIIENRDRFINDYDIKRRTTKLPNYIYKQLWNIIVDKNPRLKLSKVEESMYHYYDSIILNKCRIYDFDHQETYVTNSGDYIIIYSPYDGDNDDKFEEIGFEKIYRLYNNDASTYMKIFQKRRR